MEILFFDCIGPKCTHKMFTFLCMPKTYVYALCGFAPIILFFLPVEFSSSPSLFPFLFTFRGAVGAAPDAPEEDVPPRSKPDPYGGGLDPDDALLFLVCVKTGLLSSSSSSLVSCKAFNALGIDELFGLEETGRDRFEESD